jgi:hypothetical protein
MRIINTVTLSVVSLVASAVAAAAEPADAPHLSWEHQAVQPVSAPGHYPALDWTSVIGAGSGAALVMHSRSMQSIQSIGSSPHARQDWSAVIGTGAAAALESGPAG